MDQCSDLTARHPTSRSTLTNQPGHDLDVDLEPRACSLECSRAGGSDVRHTLHHDRLRLPYGTHEPGRAERRRSPHRDFDEGPGAVPAGIQFKPRRMEEPSRGIVMAIGEICALR